MFQSINSLIIPLWTETCCFHILIRTKVKYAEKYLSQNSLGGHLEILKYAKSTNYL